MPSYNNRGRIHVSQRETNDDVEIIGADLLSESQKNYNYKVPFYTRFHLELPAILPL